MTGIGTRVEVRPLTVHAGAELLGLDLHDFDDRAFDTLHSALLDHGVVFVPGQFLSTGELREVARRFGDIFANPLSLMVEGFDDVTEIVSHDGRAPDIFHFDTSYVDVPPMASMLSMVKSPPLGGDTLWASGYGLYESFSEPIRDLLEQLDVRYEARDKSPHGDLRAEHPVVRIHPETGRKTLYFDSHWSTRVVGLRRDESDALLAFLRSAVTDPTYMCRYRWTEGTFAMWDNRCMLHRVSSDFVGERIIHRVTVAGEKPIAARSV